MPVAYAGDPSIPIPPMPSSFGGEPAAPAQPLQPEPLQPQPMGQEPYRPEALFGHPLVSDASVPPMSFADLLTGDPAAAHPATVASGALMLPTEPAPFVQTGLRELEPALSEILAEAALAPRPATAHANALPSGFSIDEVVVEAEAAPERKVMEKRTYTTPAWVIAVSAIIQVALAYFVVVVLDQPTNRPVMAVIWFGGLFVAAGIAGYDRLLLKASGHERPAAGWWALLTPLAYLLVRWTRTRAETGKGAFLLLVWLIATALAGGLIALDPTLFLAAIQ